MPLKFSARRASARESSVAAPVVRGDLFESLEGRKLLAADLVALPVEFTGATEALPGQSLGVRANLYSTEDLQLDRPVHLLFYASRDATLDVGDVLLKDIGDVYDSFQAMANDQLELDLQVPRDLGPGAWHVLSYINPIRANTGQPDFAEADLSNNVGASATTFSLPNFAGALTGALTETFGDDVLAGTGGAVSINLTNPLPLKGAGKVSIELFASRGDTAIGEGDLLLGAVENKATSFGGGATKKFSFKPTLPQDAPEGEYFLVARVRVDDPAGTQIGSLIVAADESFHVGPAVRDLTASFDPAFAPGTLVPGDKLTLPLTIANGGNVPAAGQVTVNYYASSDGVHTDGDGDVLLASVPVKLNLKNGASKLFKHKVTLSQVVAGDYRVVAVIEPLLDTGGAPAESDATNNQAASGEVSVVWQFGAIDGRAKPAKLTLVDDDGTAATFSLKGPGTGNVLSAIGGGWSLRLDDTSGASSATIANKGGDGRLALRGYMVTSTGLPAGELNLKSLSAPTTDFSGVTWFRRTGTVTVGNIRSANVSVQSVGTMNVLGDLTNGFMTATDTQAAGDPSLTLGKLNVNGQIKGFDIYSDGNIGSVTTQRLEDAVIYAGVGSLLGGFPASPFSFNRQARIGSVTIKGAPGEAFAFVDAQIAARSIGNATIVSPNFNNGGEAFGLAALEFDKITLVVNGGKFVVPAEGGSEGDFQVRNL